MNNRIVQLMYNIFLENGFSVIKVNFRGVGKVREFLTMVKVNYHAAAALDWIESTKLGLQSMLGFWFFIWISHLYAINNEKA